MVFELIIVGFIIARFSASPCKHLTLHYTFVGGQPVG